MGSRYIDADALIDDLMERYCKECNKRRGIKNGKYRIIYEIGEAPCRACEVDDVKAELEDAPTADVVERKVGKWVDNKGLYQCSCCKNIWSELWWVESCTIDRMNKIIHYCPNCGARMKGEDDE